MAVVIHNSHPNFTQESHCIPSLLNIRKNMPLQPIIARDYLSAPNAQKSRLYLYLTQTPFSICEQPFILPRPDLTNCRIVLGRSLELSLKGRREGSLQTAKALLLRVSRSRVWRTCMLSGW
jgi:hypothetical protein